MLGVGPQLPDGEPRCQKLLVVDAAVQPAAVLGPAGERRVAQEFALDLR